MMDDDSTLSGSSGTFPKSLSDDNPAAGLSSVERGAKHGIGPLSPLGMKVWHGDASPCVSCGELVRRVETRCSYCGQDLSLVMIEKMAAHAGPWYVHEHVRPFPGVTLERLVRQVRRGVLTRTTVVRGPTTNHQWRFAAETPGLSKYLGVCWNCQAAVNADDTYCKSCDVHLDRVPGELPEMPASPRVFTAGEELDRLSQAVRTTAVSLPDDATTRRFPAVLLIVAILVMAVVAVIAVVKVRERSRETQVRTAPVAVAPLDSSAGDIGG